MHSYSSMKTLHSSFKQLLNSTFGYLSHVDALFLSKYENNKEMDWTLFTLFKE